MMFGSFGNPDQTDCVRIIHTALDAGINFVDTADVYSDGESEEIVGEALRGGRRNRVVLASKCGLPMGSGPNTSGNSRRWILQAVEDSLRRLRTDWIDLYQVHRPDLSCDLSETLGVLSDLVHQGKVRAIGCSTFPADMIVEAGWMSASRGYEAFACEQSPYSILARHIESAVLPTCQRYGLGVLAWSPLNGGWLSGRYRRSAPFPDSVSNRAHDRFDTTRQEVTVKLEAAEEIATLAEDIGIPIVQLSAAFVLAHPAVTSAIIGPRTMAHLTEILGAAELDLSDEVLDRIDSIVVPGRTIDPLDLGWTPPWLADASLRRHAVRSSRRGASEPPSFDREATMRVPPTLLSG
jgi:aryl-alcohol dehydrogenase-like predicted oxidoreductase